MKKIMKCENVNYQFPPQRQNQPGLEYLMNPRPVFDNYKGSNKLKGKVAIITGGDSGIGRAVAVAYAKEGAKVVIVYFNEEVDALYTKNYINNFGGEVLLIEGDLKEPSFSDFIVKRTCEVFGKPDILVNNAGVQIEQEKLENISDEQFDYTLKSNMYSMFYLTKRVLGVMNDGSIINVSSVTTFVGEPNLIDYVTSKGAIIGFTRSLSTNLAQKNIRVNAVAPGTFWTPLQPSTWKAEKMPILGTDNPMKRAAQPAEIAAIFVYLASDEASYTTGQVFHINGGQYKG
ncbi:MAG TPA: SDR family oxidoreductase [Candidatus Coprosoma intestinipullorum]|uniref:SDR family oxidoreductase n=1 Tax=Candidatus Coprosoma intestinipullorum TaxID=2840752 RepID=A0A9D0ZRJ3_9FIRM|nr:SDR family oxidoreductase [Candidatus Coprosoma intestinipullorum]